MMPQAGRALLDAIGTPEFAAEFRRHQRRPLVRLRKCWFLLCGRLRLRRRPWYCDVEGE